MTRWRTILGLMLTLLAAAWSSPCCCQVDWLAARGATVLLPAADSRACTCCKEPGPTGRGSPQEGCPVDSGACKRTSNPSTSPASGVKVVPAAVFALDVPEAMPMRTACRIIALADLPLTMGGAPLTLLAQHCALVV